MMEKKPLIGVSICAVVLLILSPIDSTQTNASARQSTDNMQPLSDITPNNSAGGSSIIKFPENPTDNGITWTDAQDNYYGANGFNHFNYPNKAIVKNANTYGGITPSNTVFAYVAVVYSNTLTILNATKSWAQTEYSSYSVPIPHDIQILDYPTYGRVAFVCSYENGGLYAINVTNPNSMSTLDTRYDSSNAGMYMDVDTVNKILYYTDYNSVGADYLYAYNITNPQNINLICQTIVPQGKPWSPKVNINNRNYVYVACEGEGSYYNNGSIAIFNVTWVKNVTSPSMHYMKTQGFGCFADLIQDGNYLYGDSEYSSANPPIQWALHIWDVSNPTNLTTVSVTNLTTYNHFCLVKSPSGHDYAFLRHYDTYYGDYGVNIADINNKSHPVKIGYIPDDGGGHTRDLWRCHWMQCAYNNITNSWVLYVIGYMDNSWVTFNITFNQTSIFANFTYIPSNPTNTTVVHFTDKSTDSNGTIVSWLWDFGDQNSSSLQNPDHRFYRDGIYTVHLNVTDNHGLTDSTYKTITVYTPPNSPPSEPRISGPASGKPGKSYDYTFVAVDPEGNNISYEINWGDGTVDNWYGPVESNVIITRSHTWSEKGTYTIQVRAKDVYGAIGGWGSLSVTMPLDLSKKSQQSLEINLYQLKNTIVYQSYISNE
jgi:hypothetical protein